MKRNQFTFFASFYDAISRIRNKNARLAVYDALCSFALMGEEPDLETMPDHAAIAYSLIRPNLESSLRKAQNRLAKTKQKETDNKPKTNQKQIDKKRECESEYEYESEYESECECENECLNTHSDCAETFEKFWSAYPKKVDKSGAMKAFVKIDASVDTLLAALQEQQRSSQWTADGGRYIPNAATWLSRKGWEDRLPVPGGKVPKGASGVLGPEELENIQRLLREK